MLRILKCETQAIVAAPRFRIGQLFEGFNQLGARPLYGRMAISDWDNIPEFNHFQWESGQGRDGSLAR